MWERLDDDVVAQLVGADVDVEQPESGAGGRRGRLGTIHLRHEIDDLAAKLTRRMHRGVDVHIHAPREDVRLVRLVVVPDPDLRVSCGKGVLDSGPHARVGRAVDVGRRLRGAEPPVGDAVGHGVGVGVDDETATPDRPGLDGAGRLLAAVEDRDLRKPRGRCGAVEARQHDHVGRQEEAAAHPRSVLHVRSPFEPWRPCLCCTPHLEAGPSGSRTGRTAMAHPDLVPTPYVAGRPGA
jgi:hypothetical protein